MNQLFLLKLVAEMLEGDEPTQDRIYCARKIIDNMIADYDLKKEVSFDDHLTHVKVYSENKSFLDAEAQQAKQDLLK